MNLTKQEIKTKGLKVYFKVVLWDEDFTNIQVIIGRYETLEEAQNEARKFSDEEIDSEDVLVDIFKYWYDEIHDKYKLDPYFETNF